MGEAKNKRIAGIELLRIIAMLMIIAYHFSVHAGFSFSSNTININRLWVQFLEIGGKSGVNIFVLITGYFCIKSERRNNLRLVKIWTAALFYSVIIYFTFVFFGGETFSIIQFVKHIFPITFSQWWFLSAYFMLYLVSPFLNKLLNGLSQTDYLKLLVILTLCWCITSTFLTVPIECNNFLWFTYVYALSGYIRLYKIDEKGTCRFYFCALAILVLLSFASALIFDFLGLNISVFSNHATYFFGMQKLPTLLISIAMFMAFLKIDIKNGKIITFVSPAMFGVYLLHDCSGVRTLIWNKLFKVANLQNSKMLVLCSVIEVISVFLVCTAIELIRIHFIENKYTSALNRLIERMSNKKDCIIKSKE